jgi:hypothetical protein
MACHNKGIFHPRAGTHDVVPGSGEVGEVWCRGPTVFGGEVSLQLPHSGCHIVVATCNVARYTLSLILLHSYWLCVALNRSDVYVLHSIYRQFISLVLSATPQHPFSSMMFRSRTGYLSGYIFTSFVVRNNQHTVHTKTP